MGQFFQQHEIFKQIEKAYPQPAWTVLPELRDSTGWAGRGQAADAFVFGTWPSRGFRIIGFEIKSYRGDWLRELKNPEKAEGLSRFCDEWWLVAEENVAKADEIPATWGWACPAEKGLKVLKKPAPELKPKEITRVFLMSIIRNIGKNFVPSSLVQAEVDARVQKELEAQRDSNAYHLKQTREDFEELKKRVADFEKEAGFEIGHKWGNRPKDVGAIVRAILDSNLEHHVRSVAKASGDCEKILATLKALPFYATTGINGDGE